LQDCYVVLGRQHRRLLEGDNLRRFRDGGLEVRVGSACFTLQLKNIAVCRERMLAKSGDSCLVGFVLDGLLRKANAGL
jgi:hypothetical protein